MEDVSKTTIYRDSYLTIIASYLTDKGIQKVIVDENELLWHEEEFLTLEDISDQLKSLGYSGVFYVWVEIGIKGRIYQYGNYDPPTWVKHGTTKGYA